MLPSTKSLCRDTSVRISHQANSNLEKYIYHKKSKKDVKLTKRGLIERFAKGLASKVI